MIMNEAMDSISSSVFTIAAILLIGYIAATVAVVILKVPKPYRSPIAALLTLGIVIMAFHLGWWP